jgi:hypothetical protein
MNILSPQSLMRIDYALASLSLGVVKTMIEESEGWDEETEWDDEDWDEEAE